MSVCICGAGLAGTMAAALLAQRGFEVDVYEKRPAPDLDEEGKTDVAQSALKRSINLALSQRGMEALAAVGLLDKAMESAIRMPCRVIHQEGASQAIKQPYGKPHEAIHSVSRQLLNALLLQKARSSSLVRFHFGHSLVSAGRDGTCVFRNDDASSASASSEQQLVQGRFDLVIGADGAYSGVRESMLRQDRVSFSRAYIAHGYKELNIPAKTGPDGKPCFALADHEGLHIWPRGAFMLIALPNPDCSFTATLFAPFSGPDGFNYVDENNAEEVKAYFQRRFPDVVPLIPDVVREFRDNPVGSLVTIRVDPWSVGSLLLVGDAAHAVVPFFGQGMNAAFEDCLMLDEYVESHLKALSASSSSAPASASASASVKAQSVAALRAAAQQLAQERRPAANALADLCIEHYSDMAANTASTWYLAQKRVEAALHWLFPSSFVPLYTMVAFTRTPYHEAVARHERQERVARAVLSFSAVALTAGGFAAWSAWAWGSRRTRL